MRYIYGATHECKIDDTATKREPKRRKWYPVLVTDDMGKAKMT